MRDGCEVYKCIKRELSGCREKDGVQQEKTECRGPGAEKPRLEVPTSEQGTRAEAVDMNWMLRLKAEGEIQVVERAWPLGPQGDVQRVAVGNSLDRAGDSRREILSCMCEEGQYKIRCEVMRVCMNTHHRVQRS